MTRQPCQRNRRQQAVGAGDGLLQRLEQLAERGDAGHHACIRAHRSHTLKALEIAQPTLAILLRGRKRARAPGVDLEFGRGDLMLVSRRCRLDVEHRPGAGHGYLSLVVPLCEEVLDAARRLWQAPLQQAGPTLARYPAADWRSHLTVWADALQAGRDGQARGALTGLVIALCDAGHGALLSAPPPSIADHIRRLVSADPARAWQTRDFEPALGISGATLRRRLAAERTSLRDVLRNARLARALELLYTSRLPVKTIAARVGYRSPGSFARRFAARYGLHPSALGRSRQR